MQFTIVIHTTNTNILGQWFVQVIAGILLVNGKNEANLNSMCPCIVRNHRVNTNTIIIMEPATLVHQPKVSAIVACQTLAHCGQIVVNE